LENLKERGKLEDIVIEGKVEMKRILERQDERL
jgi:hypothetical protein